MDEGAPADPGNGAEGPASRPERAQTVRDTSGPAIVATVALVAFSVFIGVYGPRLGNRQQLPAGTTLTELAQAVAARHSGRVVHSLRIGANDPPTGAEVEAALGAALGAPLHLPGEYAERVRWLAVESVRLPGASGAMAFGRIRLGGGRTDFVSLTALADEDRFLVFDGYGRPQPLPEGEVFSVGVPAEAEEGTIHVYRDGDAVFAIESATPAAADSLLAALQAARAAAPVDESDLDRPSEGRRAPDSGGGA